MKLFASKEARKPARHGDRKLSGSLGNPWSPQAAADGLWTQRKACPCGGGCPQCISPVGLRISQPDDADEREAERVAEQVMRMPQTPHGTAPDLDTALPPAQLQRECSTCASGGVFCPEYAEGKRQRQRMEEEEKAKEASESVPRLDQHPEARVYDHQNGGRPLATSERSFFERRFGVDFSNVRLHQSPRAQASAHALRADAYTLGSDIVLRDSAYDGSFRGRRLLAHELVHVTQQAGLFGQPPAPRIQRRLGDGHDLRSPRFSGHLALEDAYDPADPNMTTGSRGLEVRIIQQALLDAGQTLPIYGVDGMFEGETRAAVEGFQRAQGLTGPDVTGAIDPTTMALLDAYFLDPAHDAAIAIAQTPPSAPTPNVAYPRGSAPTELYDGTRTLTVAEIAAVERARTTEVQAPIGGSLPPFNRFIEQPPGSGIMVDYEVRIRNRTQAEIDRLHTMIGAPAAARMASPAAVYDWALIHRIADAAKAETDRVFGDYATGDAMRHGVNLDDAFERKVADYAAGGAAYQQGRVEWRVNKILDGPAMATINNDHGAVTSRAEEAGHLTNVRNHFTSDPAYRQKLIEIDHGWPAFADPATRTVFLQRLQGPTANANKENLWDIFHTIIHEYIHTLAHPDYRAYASSLPERRGGKTYREGMTEHFTHMVISTISYTDALRAIVEDVYNDPLVPFSVPPYQGYSERHNAQAVIGVVGVRNAMAAFFLGEVQFIGG